MQIRECNIEVESYETGIASLKGVLLVSHKECLDLMKIKSFTRTPLGDGISQSV
jgi:hypothetical protein